LIYLLKLLIRAALYIFCKKIYIKNKAVVNAKGPLLIIANHPNSFLDAVIIGAQYPRRVYFLARGDVFTKKHHRYLLGLLNMIPVYRLREGKEFLGLNEYAFVTSKNLLAKGEAVLIFIEGICLNTNELQPFKKGTTRILQGAQELGVQPSIHVVGIAYDNFHGVGKHVNIVFSDFPYTKQIITAKDRVTFNNEVFIQLNKNIITPIAPTSHKSLVCSFIFIIARIFYYFHAPYYFPLRRFVARVTKNTVFYDSVLFAILLFTYPLILLIIFILLYQLSFPLPIILIILVVLPLVTKFATK
jgi:1-acyl-sn-glycerol-3-phosphate acyltransferase